MSIRFFNTYSRSLETFTPLDPQGRVVKMYTCGPTVYNHAHIGNFRAYLFEDLLQRHLEARGFQVQRVGVKATTNEMMGFLGRGEGIAAMAVASVEIPEPATA